MTTDNWFAALTFLAVYVMCLLLLDGAHRARIGELKHIHREQVAGLRSYIRTLSRERLWLEAELARQKEKLQQQREQERAFDPFQTANADPVHIQWLPPSEEYGEDG